MPVEDRLCDVPRAPHLLILVSNGEFLLSHRREIAVHARGAGFKVTVACPIDGARETIEALGIRHLPIPMRRKGSTLWSELRTIASIRTILLAERPDVVHLITAKPIIYGGLWTRLFGIPAVTAVPGLGYLFANRGLRVGLLRELVVQGYRFAVGGLRSHLVFQNADDLAIFRERAILKHDRFTMIAGSGVDLEAIRPTPLPDGPVVVVLPARLLRDKGVIEFVEAARILKARGIDAVFRLLGDPDVGNPTSISMADLAEWQDAGLIEWHPHTSDIGSALARAHIVALPSYREGFPKTLIDAAAAGRPSVTSNVPGCRDAIVEGETGILIKARDARSLADGLEPLIANRDTQIRMGQAARAHAEHNFDVRDVCARHLEIYSNLVGVGKYAPC
ncbi:glycosyltransferase family 4 protein [Sphingomonas sp. ST-64]|uniref:Glycosyltransferase family 4 protein n=1 Tax=Sphingomonas plantiphila TaxID=3163295 RepID=A0ABW8YI23_9SPHN